MLAPTQPADALMKRRTFCQATVATAALATPLRLIAADKPALSDVPAIKLSGQSTVIEKAALNDLSRGLHGQLVLADSSDYDSARRIWNRMIDKRPAMIVRCADAADVSRAITFARERELLLAVRGGGHSFPGLSTCDGGMMLDVSSMKAVSVDVKGRQVVAGAGCWGGHVDGETQQHDLATTMGQISDTGIAGLTLGGGFGWLSRQFGLACDNLVSVEIVTADGKTRRASKDENPDLFWGLRGGGGNFGVATKFEYRLHPVSTQVIGGAIDWSISDAPAVIDFYREIAAKGPRELSLDLSFWVSKENERRIGIDLCHAGDIASGMKMIESLRRIGKPANDTIEVRKYVDVQRQFDEGNISDRFHYIKGGFVPEMTPAFADFLAREFEPTRGTAVYMQNASGAVGDVAPEATAFWNRKAVANLMILAAWGDPADTERMRAAVRAAWDQLAPFTAGYYVNLSDAAKDTVSRNYGANYPRLVALKKKFDPKNLFRLNSNVSPA
jgi:FAD/FMN-containing dehydrogenase